METMNEFIKVEKYGQLWIDRIIFEASYPILFICVNEKSELFICVCCQNNDKGKKWLVSKTSSATIVKMLKDEIPIRDAFLENSDCRITINRYNGKTDIRFDDENDWSENSIYLPKKGERLEAEPDEFCEEIAYYQKKKAIAYSEKYKNIVKMSEELQRQIAPALEETSNAISEIYTKSIFTEVMQTLKVFEDLHLDIVRKLAFQYETDNSFNEVQSFELSEDTKEPKVELNENEAAKISMAA